MRSHSEKPEGDLPPSGTQVIQRAGMLLRAVASRNRVGARLTDLCADSGVGRPTAHRILQALVSERLLRQDEASKRYYLGNHIYEMGLAAAPRMDIRDTCHPYLQTIAGHIGDSVFLTTRAGFEGVCLDRVEGGFPIRVFVIEVGLRRPLNVGGGAIAILACLPHDEIERILHVNRDSTLERFPRYKESSVWRMVAHVQKNGYLLGDVIEVPSVRTLAMPIRHPDGSPRGAISTSCLATRLEGARVEEVRSHVAAAVEAIEAALAAGQAQ
jgi:DNA-binding IclR family transcriptional regulator